MEEQKPIDSGTLTPTDTASYPHEITTQDPSESVLHKIFFGREGLRAGWRVLIFLLLTAALGALLLVPTSKFHPQRESAKLWLSFLSEAELFLAATVSAYIMSRFEKRKFGQYGLPRQGAFGSLFWVGAVWGIFWLSVLLFTMRAMGAFYFGHLAIHGTSILKFGAFYVLMFLMVGLFEEFLLRGYMQYTLTSGMGFWPTAILLSASFGALHGGNSGEAMLGLIAAALIGLFFCLTLRRTGSLWFAVGFHMSWDWGESFFYSTPDSGQMSPGHLMNSSFHGSRWITGGSVGPEGSVLVLILIVIMWIIFDRRYRSVKYPVLSRENQVLPSGLGLQAPAENV